MNPSSRWLKPVAAVPREQLLLLRPGAPRHKSIISQSAIASRTCPALTPHLNKELEKHARSLLLHGNHLLVSLSCSAASLHHDIPPHQHHDRGSSTNKRFALFFFFLPSSFSPSPALFGSS
ncbi:unnamed protein product [Pleuronectes platessa]|uniref:Uncharacterized protein n=1 Tax=Pleuronectes platessa TaxID=8262 RepID=A0A9N7V3L9_PLEPL|nr:unnamed protein product [Pleuronectes platessa]